MEITWLKQGLFVSPASSMWGFFTGAETPNWSDAGRSGGGHGQPAKGWPVLGWRNGQFLQSSTVSHRGNSHFSNHLLLLLHFPEPGPSEVKSPFSGRVITNLLPYQSMLVWFSSISFSFKSKNQKLFLASFQWLFSCSAKAISSRQNLTGRGSQITDDHSWR